MTEEETARLVYIASENFKGFVKRMPENAIDGLNEDQTKFIYIAGFIHGTICVNTERKFNNAEKC